MKTASHTGANHNGKKPAKRYFRWYYVFYPLSLALLCLGGCLWLKYSVSGRNFYHAHNSIAREVSMTRRLPHTLLTLFLGLLFSHQASAATTYYIAANGSDNNNGTSKTSPWAHAPGMKNCAGGCASATPQPGDQFIFRGGDTWHTSTGALIGLPWTWTWSGTSASPIYVGVDQTWSSGSTWARPILTMDNPVTNSNPSSCTYDDSSMSALKLTSVNWVTVDNFEFTGKCWSANVSQNSVAYFYRTGTNITIENAYFHGWTLAGTAWDGHAAIGGYGAATASYNVISSVVIDGSDSTLGTTSSACGNAVNGAPCNTGWGIQGDCYDVHQSVIRYTSNAVVCANPAIIHDNLIEYTYATMDGMANNTQGPHPNVIEALGGYDGLILYFYNNILRYNGVNVNIWPQFSTAYEFNNVFFANASVQSGNCFMQSPPGFSSGSESATAYIYNNTIDAQCTFNFYPGNSSTPTWSGASNWQNNQLIGFSTTSVKGISSCPAPASCSFNDNGSEIFQAESAANSQGYTPSDNYAPTSSSGSTVGGGTSLASLCNGMGNSAATTACQSGMAGVTYDSTNHVAVAGQAVPRSSSQWDAGAYQYASSSQIPLAPTGLTAVVQQ